VSTSPGTAREKSSPKSTRTEPIRVIVADDHVVYRRGLQTVMSAEEDIDIVGEADNGRQAVEAAIDLAPDVILMDIRMPRLSGIDACRSIKSNVPSTRIVMLTFSDDEADLFAAVKAGADGYLLKDVPAEDVAEAVRAVNEGHSLVPPSMASRLLAEFAELSRRQDGDPVETPRLTGREQEVLRLVARGRRNKDIGDELFISEHTVKNHVRNILEKLQLHSRMEAAMYAVRARIIDPEDE
jgi:DNA-binding NarL/FixJ family response regulator